MKTFPSPGWYYTQYCGTTSLSHFDGKLWSKSYIPSPSVLSEKDIVHYIEFKRCMFEQVDEEELIKEFG